MIARFRILVLAFLLLTLSMLPVTVSAATEGYTADLTPIQRHQLLAEAKIKAFDRRMLTPAPASVVSTAGYDATYYDIILDIDELNKWIVGEVTMHAKGREDAFDTPTINLHSSMTVDSVKQSGQTVAFSRAGNYIYVTLNSPVNTGEEFDLTIWYQGRPTTGGFMGFSFSEQGGYPMISTLSEPYMAQSWWPCKDTPSDKADSADIAVTVNSLLYVVSNGVLRDSVDNGNGTTTYWWHESYPITTYLISLAITNYSRFDHWYHYGPGDADSTPVKFYSYPSLVNTAKSAWPIAVDQMDFFSALWGEYPFVNEKYGMAHFNWGGAMEHQTVTSATSSDFGFDQYLIAHELAHQWWGDMITCRDWQNIWMNEGFASYAEALWAEHRYGAAAYRSYMSGMSYWAGGRIYCDDTTDVSSIFSNRVYDKGAWVLHMLRGVVGDSAFFEILRTYYSHPLHQYKDVVTEDFQAICEQVSGTDLNDFFQNWIYGYYFPKYYFSWTAVPHDYDNFYDVHVHIRQTQTSTPQVFSLPIELVFNGVGGTPVHRVWNTQREQDYKFVSPAVPTSISFDPDNWILKYLYTEAYTMHLVSDSVAGGTQWMPYMDSLEVVGGAQPYHFQIVSGLLPAGVAIDEATGVISGVPTESGSFNFSVRVYDNVYTYSSERAYTMELTDLGYRPGDQNMDYVLDAVDVNDLIDLVFFNGDPAAPDNAADVNGDCEIDAVDLNVLIDVVFFGGDDPLPGCVE
ncbi:MAG: M1 family aminopeptidase [Candidatus Zixiibacteriota bacterium]